MAAHSIHANDGAILAMDVQEGVLGLEVDLGIIEEDVGYRCILQMLQSLTATARTFFMIRIPAID